MSKWYIVQDVAGPRPDIAGKRRKVGDRIYLTDDQARHEVSRGVVVEEEKHKADQEAKAKQAEDAVAAAGEEPAKDRAAPELTEKPAPRKR